MAVEVIQTGDKMDVEIGHLHFSLSMIPKIIALLECNERNTE
jgi:hypothetical protein